MQAVWRRHKARQTPVTTADIRDQGRILALTREGRTTRFHAVWLRDNAQDAETRSPANGQRLVTILDQPSQVTITRASCTGATVEITFAPEGKTVAFDLAWLDAHAYDRIHARSPGWLAEHRELWDASLQEHVPSAAWSAVSDDPQALGGWLAAVERYGFALLTGVPGESGFLCEVAGLFGYVRQTNYGRWFEVRAEVNPNNLAYTNLGLQAHTDNPYRDPVPTLQLLACLENSVAGGESMVVDGFAVADRIRRETPRYFDLLARFPARFEYAGTAGVRLRAKRPVVELGPDGELIAVRFNNRSLAPATDVPFDDMPDYYAAMRRFAELIEHPEFQVTFKLAAGELFIVDNTRVLHARRAFSGTGRRWLQGCYADIDGLRSTLAAIADRMPEAAQ